MNTNAIRTIINAISGGTFVSIAKTLSGCTFDDPATPIVEPLNCAGSWIPVQYQAYFGAVMIIAGLLMKAFGGPDGGTVGEKLAAPAVPVVPAEKAKVGVVTPEQVAAPGAKK